MATVKQVLIPNQGEIDVLYLNREDLKPVSRKLSIKLITIYDFHDLTPIAKAKVAVFVDEDERIYLMKNRHEFGVIAYIR
ncbi:hypothetical protein GCM10027347_62480 [Larkinella harenae]